MDERKVLMEVLYGCRDMDAGEHPWQNCLRLLKPFGKVETLRDAVDMGADLPVNDDYLDALKEAWEDLDGGPTGESGFIGGFRMGLVLAAELLELADDKCSLEQFGERMFS